MFNLLQTVYLKKANDLLPKGAKGVVTHVYSNIDNAYEVEFENKYLLTVHEKDITDDEHTRWENDDL